MLIQPAELTTLDDAPAYWFLNALHILLTGNTNEQRAYSLIYLAINVEISPQEFFAYATLKLQNSRIKGK